MSEASPSVVAVTGITGTVGRGLLPFLEDDPAIERVIGIGSRPWQPAAEGLRKVVYRQIDVRDRRAIGRAFKGAEAVVHLAFSLYGLRQREAALEAINVRGSVNVLAGASAAGARQFIYTSSAAVYGFDPARSVRVGEDAPVAPEPRHFYSKHKASVERRLLDRLERIPKTSWTFFRPCAVVGPHAIGGAAHALPAPLGRAAASLFTIGAAAGLRPAIPAPPVALQFVHERDVGKAIHLAMTNGNGNGIYNLGGDGLVEPADIPRLVGLRTLPLPGAVSRAAARAAATVPYVRPGLGWLELTRHPLEVDSSRAKRELGWKPEFTSREALASTRRALAL